MFCTSCGGKLQEGVAFCSGCGAKTDGGVAVQTALAPQAQTVMVRDFRCNGCGTPLKIPTNSRAPVRCPSCKTECIIERLIQNTEIAAKENINSGIPLTATPDILHRKLVSVLSESPNIPLDVFEGIEVLREEHFCVPAYCFICNGTATFTYDVARIETVKHVKDLGDRVVTEYEDIEQWDNGRSSTASVSRTLFYSGNKEMFKHLLKLYGTLNPMKLVDIEELVFPHDVLTCDFNAPETAAWDKCKGTIDFLLKKKAEEMLSKQKTRDVQMGGSHIPKETQRVFLGVYRIVFAYRGQDFTVWMSGDGENAYHEGLPEDMHRKMALDNRKQSMEREMASIPVPKTGGLTAGMWSCIGVGVLFFFVPMPVSIIGFVLAAVGAVIFGVQRAKKIKPYNAYRASIQERIKNDIEAYNAQTSYAVQQFKSQKKALRGIYEGIASDTSIASPSSRPTPQAQINIPEGFIFDHSNGLYYQAIPGTDPATGVSGSYVTWFYPQTGEYKQQFYPR